MEELNIHIRRIALINVIQIHFNSHSKNGGHE